MITEQYTTSRDLRAQSVKDVFRWVLLGELNGEELTECVEAISAPMVDDQEVSYWIETDTISRAANVRFIMQQVIFDLEIPDNRHVLILGESTDDIHDIKLDATSSFEIHGSPDRAKNHRQPLLAR